MKCTQCEQHLQEEEYLNGDGEVICEGCAQEQGAGAPARLQVIAFESVCPSERDHFVILEDRDADNLPNLARLPIHLSDEEILAVCATCGWECSSVDRRHPPLTEN